ncbi:MAG TPA: flagellar export chaperone FliS [Candidatus Binatia bacterium]|jgi:flagellar protein FliS
MNKIESLKGGSMMNSINLGDKAAILLMLYNAAIELLEEGKTALEEGQVVEKGAYLSKAHAIISELLVSLDVNVGGDLARSLEDLYIFMMDQLMTANMHNDTKPIDAVLSVLRTLREGWEGAVSAERARVAQEYVRRVESAA